MGAGKLIMDKLWAPWRITYIKNKGKKKCIFCEAKKLPRKHHVIFKTKYSLCMLNIYPYNNGHTLVSPLRHVAEFSNLKDAETLDLFKALGSTKKILDKTLKPHGYNIGINLGSEAGAGIPGHLHIHIVPRWRGDTNFMPTIYATKVISQSLEELQIILKKCLTKKR
jgi:ATP adenylyltransferase